MEDTGCVKMVEMQAVFAACVLYHFRGSFVGKYNRLEIKWNSFSFTFLPLDDLRQYVTGTIGNLLRYHESHAQFTTTL